MGTLPMTAGGVLKMIAPTVLTAVTVVTVATKMQILLLPMALTQTGTTTRGLLNILLAS
jgi:hypothetical protein